MTLLLHQANVPEALKQFQQHMGAFRKMPLPPPPAAASAHGAWLVRQYTVIGELLSSRVEAGLLPQQVKQAAGVFSCTRSDGRTAGMSECTLASSRKLAPQRGSTEVLSCIYQLSEILLDVLFCLKGGREQHLINQLHQIEQALQVPNIRERTRWTPEQPDSC